MKYDVSFLFFVKVDVNGVMVCLVGLVRRVILVVMVLMVVMGLGLMILMLR